MNIIGAVAQWLFTWVYKIDLLMFLVRFVVGLNQGIIVI